MLLGHIDRPRRIRLIDAPDPELPPGGEEMIFEPELACLCGSDLVFWEADYPEYPPAPGHSLHEMIGRVAAAPPGGPFQPGDRVLCVPEDQRGVAERIRVSPQRAIPLDPRPPREHALLAQPLGTVLCALRKLPNLIGWDAAVVGQGPMGQLFCCALRSLGARRIIALDRIEQRLAVSPRMGATHVVNVDQEDPEQAVARITGGRLVDLAIEAVGHREPAWNTCIRICRPRGRILLFGLPTRTLDGVLWHALTFKNLTVHASILPDFAVDFPLAMQWIAEGRVEVAPIITHRFPLARLQEAFELFHSRRDGVLKVLIDFPAGRAGGVPNGS